MAVYKSKPVTVGRPATEMYERLSDLSRLQGSLDKLPEEQRQQIDNVQFSADSIRIQTPQVGEIAFKIIEKIEPEKVVFGTESSPVPLTMTLVVAPVSDSASTVAAEINVEIPAMLRPLVGPQLQKAADQLGNLIGTLNA